MFYTITAAMREVRPLLPEGAKVVRESRNWVTVEIKDKTWDEMREIYKGVACVAISHQYDANEEKKENGQNNGNADGRDRASGTDSSGTGEGSGPAKAGS